MCIRIGQTINADSAFHSVSGPVIGGYDLDTGEWTMCEGAPIDDERTVHVRADDDGHRYKLAGYAWEIRPAV